MMNAFEFGGRSHGISHGFDSETQAWVDMHLQNLGRANGKFLASVPRVFRDIWAMLLLACLRGVTDEILGLVKGLGPYGFCPVFYFKGV